MRRSEETEFVIAHRHDYPSGVAVGSLETQRMARNTLLAASNDRQWMYSSSGKAKFNSIDFAIEGTSLNRFGSNESRRFHIDPAG